jgi:hypothetical protein
VSRTIVVIDPSNPWLGSLVGESRIEGEITVLGVKVVVQARIGHHQHGELKI